MPNMELEEFEAGENVTDQAQRSRPNGIVVSVRLATEDTEKLLDLAEENGKTVSQLARQAIRAFLSQRGQRPVFLPEITGGGANVDIVTVGPLGPRTEGSAAEDDLPRTSHTGLLVASR